jgi:hypothetical protein
MLINFLVYGNVQGSVTMGNLGYANHKVAQYRVVHIKFNATFAVT